MAPGQPRVSCWRSTSARWSRLASGMSSGTSASIRWVRVLVTTYAPAAANACSIGPATSASSALNTIGPGSGGADGGRAVDAVARFGVPDLFPVGAQTIDVGAVVAPDRVARAIRERRRIDQGVVFFFLRRARGGDDDPVEARRPGLNLRFGGPGKARNERRTEEGGWAPLGKRMHDDSSA